MSVETSKTEVIENSTKHQGRDVGTTAGTDEGLAVPSSDTGLKETQFASVFDALVALGILPKVFTETVGVCFSSK